MSETPETDTQMRTGDPLKLRLLDAIKPHVIFDGWGADSFAAACLDCDVTNAAALAVCPRGAIDLAAACHQQGDREMGAVFAAAETGDMRIREKVAHAVMTRLLVADREVVRRGTSLFALPVHAAEGAGLIWGTADAIWTLLGDSSRDGNWYTKRGVLSAVYSATVLFWLGDETAEYTATRAFLDRRIENVMQFEKAKASAQKLPLIGRFVEAAIAGIKAPSATPPDGVPGTMRDH